MRIYPGTISSRLLSFLNSALLYLYSRDDEGEHLVDSNNGEKSERKG
jgi:hypothetical protein